MTLLSLSACNYSIGISSGQLKGVGVGGCVGLWGGGWGGLGVLVGGGWCGFLGGFRRLVLGKFRIWSTSWLYFGGKAAPIAQSFVI